MKDGIQPRNLLALPPEILQKIVLFIDFRDIFLIIQRINKYFYEMVNDAIFSKIFLKQAIQRYFPFLVVNNEGYDKKLFALLKQEIGRSMLIIEELYKSIEEQFLLSMQLPNMSAPVSIPFPADISPLLVKQAYDALLHETSTRSYDDIFNLLQQHSAAQILLAKKCLLKALSGEPLDNSGAVGQILFLWTVVNGHTTPSYSQLKGLISIFIEYGHFDAVIALFNNIISNNAVEENYRMAVYSQKRNFISLKFVDAAINGRLDGPYGVADLFKKYCSNDHRHVIGALSEAARRGRRNVVQFLITECQSITPEMKEWVLNEVALNEKEQVPSAAPLIFTDFASGIPLEEIPNVAQQTDAMKDSQERSNKEEIESDEDPMDIVDKKEKKILSFDLTSSDEENSDDDGYRFKKRIKK